MLELDVTYFPKDFEWDNGQFPPLDALTYWHFLKNAEHVIEIGCGYSTFLAKRSGIRVTAIDPEPRQKFPGIEYTLRPLQDVPTDIFKILKRNDILFVDSSHIVEKNSDVEHILFRIIPELAPGVLVQFHDYFRPDNYPYDWKNDPVMSRWNEHFYVELIANKYSTIVVNNTVSNLHNEELIQKYPFVPKDIKKNFGAVRGSSIWFRI